MAHRKDAGIVRRIPVVFDWVRLAMAIDCEGSINITARHLPKGRTPVHDLTISVVNTDPRLPLWCYDTFGGYTNIRYGSGNRKAIFRWTITTKGAESILRGCLPYFMLKREQAEIALVLRESYLYSGPGRAVPDNVIEIREELRKRLVTSRKVDHGTA